MAKKLIFNEEARKSILRGIETLAKAVKITLGAKGRNAILDRKYGSPIITKDGVTVAKEIELEDIFENVGARLIKEVAEKTAYMAGDGTTTATILAEAIYKEGLKNIVAGASPVAIKRGIEKAVEVIVAEMQKMSKEVKGKKEITQIATIAANGDNQIGGLIADAMEQVGKDGVITVEEARSMSTTMDVVEGMQFDRGYISPYFVTNQEKMICEIDNPCILLHEKPIANVKTLLPLLEKVARNKRALVIISENVVGDSLATLIVNKMKGTLQVAAVKSPGFGNKRKEMLEDIAILTGGKVITPELEVKLETVNLPDLGNCGGITIDKETTTIIAGLGDKKAIEERIKQIKAQIEKSDSDYDKEKLQERLAKLSGGVAVINVGAATETEMKEKKARVEDALHATRAAVEEGIIPGGEIALIRGIPALEQIAVEYSDEIVGINVIRKAIEEPLRQLVVNAGVDGSVIMEKIKEAKVNVGYDVEAGKITDMFEAGVIDPTKVARTALQNAASIASLLLISEVVVAEEPEKEKPPSCGGVRM